MTDVESDAGPSQTPAETNEGAEPEGGEYEDENLGDEDASQDEFFAGDKTSAVEEGNVDEGVRSQEADVNDIDLAGTIEPDQGISDSVTAAELRNLSSVIKSRRRILHEVQDADEKSAKVFYGDERKAGREDTGNEPPPLSKQISDLVHQSIEKISEGIDDEAKALLTDEANAGDEKSEETNLLSNPPRLSDIIGHSPESHQSKKDQKLDTEASLPALSKISRGQSTECAHDFDEHTYGTPTYCNVCDGLLVGLWSQGFQCKMCGMNVHRGQGLGEHDDCRGEALLTPCPGLDPVLVSANEPKVKFRDVIKDVHTLAKQSPNFLKDVGEQLDRDIKAIAKDAIVATGVEDERSKNLRRIKTRVVPFVQSADAIASHGEVHAFLFLICIQAVVALVVTAVSLSAFLLVLWPRHGLLTDTSMRLAAVHDATVTAALHTIFAILSLVLYQLAALFKKKANIIDRYLRDMFQIDLEADIGVSVAGAADRTRAWSKRILFSAVVSFAVASILWHAMQPTSWEAATLPPLAGVYVPSAALIACGTVLALVSFWRVSVVPLSQPPLAQAKPSEEQACKTNSSDKDAGSAETVSPGDLASL